MRDRYPSAIKRIIETEEGKPSMEDPIPQVQGADIDLHDDEVDRIDTFLEAVQTKFREYGLPPLKDYQREGTQFVIKSVLEYKCSLLGDEMGLGKTVTSMLVMRYLNQSRKSKAIIICPATMVLQWKLEIDKWCGRTFDWSTPEIAAGYYGCTVEDQIHRFRIQDAEMSPAIILSHEGYLKHMRLFRPCTSAGPMKENDDKTVVYFDEAHRFKGLKGAKKEFLRDVMLGFAKVGISGTTVSNGLVDVHRLVDMLSRGRADILMGKKETELKKLDTSLKRSYAAISNLDAANAGDEEKEALLTHLTDLSTVKSNLTRVMVRRLWRDTVPTTMEPGYMITMFLNMKEAQQDQYQRLVGTASGSDISGRQNEARSLCNFAEIDAGSSDFSQSQPSHHESTKMELLGDILAAAVSEQRKTVVVSYFVNTLKAVAKMCDKRGISYLILTSSTSDAERAAHVEAFSRADNHCMVFLLSKVAGGVGLNLAAACILVLFEPEWNPAHDLQAMARILRITQQRSTLIIRFVISGRIDDKVLQIQNHKMYLNAVLPGSADLDPDTEFAKAKLARIDEDHVGDDEDEPQSLNSFDPAEATTPTVVMPRGQAESIDTSSISGVYEHFLVQLISRHKEGLILPSVSEVARVRGVLDGLQ